ncbi:MAG: hypothetical protein JKY70_03960 [Mucilaginibacter sp.]|nr:hypothetical protein [Mucilaginibacter sp.]
MNKTKATILGIIIWVILTVVFAKSDAASDGYSLMGFPFYFYTYFSGKQANTVSSGTAFKIDLINLLADLFFAIAFVLLINFILLRIFKPKTTTL